MKVKYISKDIELALTKKKFTKPWAMSLVLLESLMILVKIIYMIQRTSLLLKLKSRLCV